MLIILDNISHVRMLENKNNLFEIFAYADHSQWLGDYSTEEKAIKVLDMIQDAYARCESTRTLSSGTILELARKFNQTQADDFKKEHRANFVFQMPQDSEV